MEEYEGSSDDEQYSLPKEWKEHGFGSHVAEDVRRPCMGRRRSSSQVQVTYISLQIRSSVPTYLLISHTGYDPATAFGHTGMFRETAPVGGPYPGMVPGPQIPVYTG